MNSETLKLLSNSPSISSSNPLSFSPNRVGIRNSTDYSPFGVELDGRTVSLEGYRFGYQGSEKDNEFKGQGNSYTTEFRQLDPRLGRWLSVDPLFQPLQSSYCLMDDSPISKNDALGNKANDWIKRQNSKYWEYDSGIQSASEAQSRYGNGTEYKDDGGTYQGNQGEKRIGTVTLNQGGLQTWKNGSQQNPDINPNPQPSSNFCPATNIDLVIVKPEVAFLLYAKLEREEKYRIESSRSAYFAW